MRKVRALLANYAELQNGLLYIAGGSPEWWDTELPSVSRLSLVAIIEHSDEDADTHHWTFSVRDNQGERPIGTTTISTWRSEPPPEGAVRFSNFVFLLTVELGLPGRHDFLIREGSELVASVPLFVRETGG